MGHTTHTCSVCGDSYQDNTTPALGHSYTDTVTAPTCTEAGYTTHTCTACGDSYQDTYVDALGHSYTATVVAPTCTQQGYTLHECSACGDSYQDTYVAALGHHYVLVKNPLQGGIVYRCSRCGHIKVEDEIPIIPVDPPVEVASYSLSSGSGEAERILDSTVVQEYAYVYNGSSLMQMVVQTTVDDGEPTTDTLYFSYDATGIPMSLVYNGTDYYYTVNLQGDVTAILNTSGTAVVEYTYDAWGNILSVTGSMANTLGAVNPLTYRGYVYDTETGLYYLQSRYYNPEIGRFINADGYVTTGQGLTGNNMFSYCYNNPTYMIDCTGACPHDGKFYTSGPFAGKFQYNPDCWLCACHGEFWISDCYGRSYDLTQYEYHEFVQMAICTDGSDNPFNSSSHQNGTSYSINDEYMDPSVIYYVVAPNKYQGVQDGDLALVIDRTTGNSIFAIIGDRGPSGKYNEVSLSVAWDLGYPWADGSKGPMGDFVILYYPGTKQQWTSVAELANYLHYHCIQ